MIIVTADPDVKLSVWVTLRHVAVEVDAALLVEEMEEITD